MPGAAATAAAFFQSPDSYAKLPVGIGDIRQCSFFESEPDVRYGTHLTGALTPQAGAKALCVPKKT
jgi:hypothetical protein